MSDQRSNRAQAQAIEHASGPMQVLAGPGSGKTYLTIRRIRHLIRHHGISPHKILVITFTKAAAQEMKERFLVLTGHAYPEVHFGTFHSVYYHILRQSGNSDLKLASAADKRKYLTHILRMIKSGEENNAELYQNLLKAISAVKNLSTISGASEIIKNHGEELQQQFPYIYEEYCRIMEDERKIDFDDMILLCDKLLTHNSDVLTFWQNAFFHIMIDEFQDISPLQYQIIRRLSLPQNNLFIVGDDDQSIYGFRGAGPDIMRQFMSDYGEARQLTLGINYRCTEEIVEAAQIVIEDNKNRFAKELTANKKREGKKKEAVKISSFADKEEEHKYLMERLKEMTKEELSQSAVIYRTNAEAGALSRELAACNIPFYAKNNIENIFETPIAQDLFSYLSFAEAIFKKGKGGSAGGLRGDFYRIMNKPSRYIQRQAAGEPMVTERLLLDYYNKKPHMQETVRKLWSDLSMLSTLRPYLAVDYIRKNMGYEEYLCSEKDKEKKEEIIELLAELQKSAANLRSFTEWKDYVQEYTCLLHKKESTENKVQEGIRLLTMHMSKGLEYTRVYLPDIKKGAIPNRKALSPEAVEEERRLLYVAMTRAKEYLEILYYGEPSPFIGKLKETLEAKA